MKILQLGNPTERVDLWGCWGRITSGGAWKEARRCPQPGSPQEEHRRSSGGVPRLDHLKKSMEGAQEVPPGWITSGGARFWEGAEDVSPACPTWQGHRGTPCKGTEEQQDQQGHSTGIFPPCCSKDVGLGMFWASPSTVSNKTFFFQMFVFTVWCLQNISCWVRHSQNVMMELSLGINSIGGQRETQAPRVGHGWDLNSCKAFCLHGATPREPPKRHIKSHRTCSAPRLMNKLHFELRNTAITPYLAVIYTVLPQLCYPTADHVII